MEWIKKSDVGKLFEKWIVTIIEDFVPGRVISYQIDNRFLDELKELETKTIDEGFKVGDEVWVFINTKTLKSVQPSYIYKTTIDKTGIYYYTPEHNVETYGKIQIYKTRQEAEQELEQVNEGRKTERTCKEFNVGQEVWVNIDWSKVQPIFGYSPVRAEIKEIKENGYLLDCSNELWLKNELYNTKELAEQALKGDL
jgi:ribosomal protein L21E